MCSTRWASIPTGVAKIINKQASNFISVDSVEGSELPVPAGASYCVRATTVRGVCYFAGRTTALMPLIATTVNSGSGTCFATNSAPANGQEAGAAVITCGWRGHT